MCIAFYNLAIRPFREKFTHTTEFYNEFCLIMITISLMGMTEATDELNAFYCGRVYVGIIGGNLLYHFYFLFKNTVNDVKLLLRKRKHK